MDQRINIEQLQTLRPKQLTWFVGCYHLCLPLPFSTVTYYSKNSVKWGKFPPKEQEMWYLSDYKK